MKSKIIIITLISAVSILSACGGDHTTSQGKDTVANRFGVAKDTAKMDTSKAISNDNSASGGTKAKDTTVKK